MAEMVTVAMVFDSQDADGTATIGPHRERLTDPAERAGLVRYLRAGRLVLSTSGRDRDRLVPELGPVVPLSLRTDGTWAWSEALAYYVERHGVAPEAALRAHAAAREYEMPAVPDEAVRAAGRAFLEQS